MILAYLRRLSDYSLSDAGSDNCMAYICILAHHFWVVDSIPISKWQVTELNFAASVTIPHRNVELDIH